MQIDYILEKILDLVRISGQLDDGECLTHVQQDRNKTFKAKATY